MFSWHILVLLLRKRYVGVCFARRYARMKKPEGFIYAVIAIVLFSSVKYINWSSLKEQKQMVEAIHRKGRSQKCIRDSICKGKNEKMNVPLGWFNVPPRRLSELTPKESPQDAIWSKKLEYSII